MEEKEEKAKEMEIATKVHDKIEEVMKGLEKRMKEIDEKMKEIRVPLHMPFVSTSRSNVVASRIGDEELRVIDMLTEAGLFSTRSEAVAYLVSEGIKARKDIVNKVSKALEDIRRIRKETEEHVTKLKREIGLLEPEIIGEHQKKRCPECGKGLTNLPEDIAICPYCGFNLKPSK